jgi:hypothetical protein
MTKNENDKTLVGMFAKAPTNHTNRVPEPLFFSLSLSYDLTTMGIVGSKPRRINKLEHLDDSVHVMLLRSIKQQHDLCTVPQDEDNDSINEERILVRIKYTTHTHNHVHVFTLSLALLHIHIHID